jgi:hypothetical protein
MKKKGCIIVALLVLALGTFVVIGVKRALTPWSLADKEPRRMVEMFVCDPIVESITDIEASGVIAFAGGNANITFRIDPEDVEKLIKRGRFKPVESSSPEWVREFAPESGETVLSRYLRDSEGTSESALFISQGRERCWFREVQY